MEDYIGKIGLTPEKLQFLIGTYPNSAVIQFLQSLCKYQIPPFKCPPLLKLFFRSIRKAVCPAISITPRAVWVNLRIFLESDFDCTPSVQLVNSQKF